MERRSHYSTRVHYAVIQLSGQPPERLVIAYLDENCLFELIAKSSILSRGFTSREEATATLGESSNAPSSKHKLPITAMFDATDENGEFMQRLGG